MRARYPSTSCTDEVRPAAIARWSSAIVASYTSTGPRLRTDWAVSGGACTIPSDVARTNVAHSLLMGLSSPQAMTSDRETDSGDESRLLSLEVSAHLTEQTDVPPEYVVQAHAARVVAGEKPGVLIFFAESKREYGRIGVDPVPEPRHPPASRLPGGPVEHLGHRGVRRRRERCDGATWTGRRERTAPEERIVVPPAQKLEVDLADRA